MAEAYYNQFTKSNDASSAGILDFTPQKYGKPIASVIQVMEEEGIDVSSQRVKTLTEEMIEKNNKVFAMCKKEESPQFLLNSKKVTFWEISDPFGTSSDNFRKIRDEIKEKVISIVSLIP